MTVFHKSKGAVLIIGAMLSGWAPAFAHHSFAIFDAKREVTIEGVVKEFQWTNPHMWIEVLVPENGQQTQYSIEGGPPIVMGRKGWSRLSFKPGDKVKITLNPTKDGSKSGSFVRAVFADGHIVEGRF